MTFHDEISRISNSSQEVSAKEIERAHFNSTPWWQREDLRYREGQLWFGNSNVAVLAQNARLPTYLYNFSRVTENLARLHYALERTANKFSIYYAIKANRYLPLLKHLANSCMCGIDACSPREVMRALEAGFSPSLISYTATSVSNYDLDFLTRYPQITVNCDALSTIRRLGERCPGRAIGIRINSGIGVSYRNNEKFHYSGNETTKFGVYREQFNEALSIAAKYRLAITGLHCHAGCGYLNEQKEQFDEVLKQINWFTQHVSDIDYLNIGGGLGVPMQEGDRALDLAVWTEMIRAILPNAGCRICTEPGAYLVRDAGLLVLKINTVEQKRETLFIGVNGGFNLQPDPAFYDLPLEIIPCRLGESGFLSGRQVSIAGNINEALDILSPATWLPPVKEGDDLVMLNSGAYGSSMLSNHCMRGDVQELVTD